MRGLESLIPNYKRDNGPKEKDSVFLIETNLIRPNPYQPRKEFNTEDLNELATSVKKYGILQPLLVSKIEEDVPSGRKVHYELIAGERRLRAAEIARLPRVPVIIRDSQPNEKLEISLIENIQREDLNPIEEAYAYKRLTEEFGLSQNEVAKRVGKSRPVIANALRTLRLPDAVLNALRAGTISDGHTRPLLSLETKEDQLRFFKEIVEKKLTVREAEDYSRDKLERATPTRVARVSLDPALKDLAGQLKKHPNFSRVVLRAEDNSVRLALEFSSRGKFLEWLKKWMPE